MTARGFWPQRLSQARSSKADTLVGNGSLSLSDDTPGNVQAVKGAKRRRMAMTITGIDQNLLKWVRMASTGYDS